MPGTLAAASPGLVRPCGGWLAASVKPLALCLLCRLRGLSPGPQRPVQWTPEALCTGKTIKTFPPEAPCLPRFPVGSFRKHRYFRRAGFNVLCLVRP